MARTHEARIDRPVPNWAAMLLGVLSQDRPTVLTRADLLRYIEEVGLRRDPVEVIRTLVELHWLTGTHIKGVWNFLPPGETTTGDPYLDLRAWLAKDPDARFALAGEAAALHLGYLDRLYDGKVALWMPEGHRPPAGVRPLVSIVRLALPDGADFAPSWALLRRKGLDVNDWATGLPAFGPEALLVQLAARPASFGPWADLVAHLPVLTADCDPDRVIALIQGQSMSTWQRTAYLLQAGGRASSADEVFAKRPAGKLAHVIMGEGDAGAHDARFAVLDRLVAPLLAQTGKA